MWLYGAVLHVAMGLMGAGVLIGMVAEAGAQSRRSQWYAGGAAGANWPSRMEQEGHNLDTTCYPGEDCDRLPGGRPPGYRWRYDVEGRIGTAYEFSLGRMFSHLRVEFSATRQQNDIDSDFSGISYVDGSPILSIETDIRSEGRASVGDLTIRTLSLNLYYDLPSASNRVTPYAGAGLGIGFVDVTDLFYEVSYSGPGGPYDPPLKFYASRTDEDLSDTTLTKHLYAGVDFGLTERMLLGVKLSHTRMGNFVATGGYEVHPIPGLTSETRFSGMNHWSLGLTAKLLFGR